MKKSNADLVWANEMLEVWQNRGIDSIDCHWSSPSAEEMARWVRSDDKNETKFIADLVPKATAILARHGVGDVADAVTEIDVKTIRDLQGLLTDALKKSKDGPHSEQEPEPEPVYVNAGVMDDDACKSLEDTLDALEEEPPMQHFANGTPAFLGFKPEPTGKIDDTDLEPPIQGSDEPYSQAEIDWINSGKGDLTADTELEPDPDSVFETDLPLEDLF